jgi:uncharacterized protein (DUF1330 family)
MELDDIIKSRKDFESRLILKALEDEEFKKELLEDANAAIEKAGGKPVPEGIKIKVVEDDPDTVTIVLPKLPDEIEESGELSDEALKQVAGGAVTAVGVTNSTIAAVTILV